MATIQDVEQAAKELGESIQLFADADDKAHADADAAQAADAQAQSSELASADAKQVMLDSHEHFDEVLREFLYSEKPVPAKPAPASVPARK